MPRLAVYSVDYGVASLCLAGLVGFIFAIWVFNLLLSHILFISGFKLALAATIISGVAAYFQFVKDPWMTLLNTYLKFRKFDNHVKDFRDQLVWEDIVYRFGAVEVSRWVWELYRILPSWKTIWLELPPTATTYKYEPINGMRSFRLLKILKWSPIYGLRTELKETSLDDIREYEAISYFWGDASQRSKTHIINIDGQNFAVSKNVYDILEHRSSARRPFYIWIDTICIDQENILERNQQVTFMREIYRQARRVIVWLGSASDGHLAIFLLLKIYNAKYQIGLPNETIHDIYGRDGIRHTRPWLALGKLLRNPYFNRVWVIQEVASASSVRVLYDGKEISWIMLLQMMQLFSDTHLLLLFLSAHEGNLNVRRKPPTQAITDFLAMAYFRGKIQSGEGVILKDLVKWTRGFEATVPQDQVFALVGITEDSSHPLLLPDYKKSIRDTFRDATLYLLDRNDIFILYYAGCGHLGSISTLPSWVPDLTRRNQPLTHGTDFKPYAASGNTIANILTNSRNPDIIELSCSIIDTIAHLGSPNDLYSAHQKPDSTLNFSNLSYGFDQTREANDLAIQHAPNPYHTSQPLAEALWRVAIGDKTRTERPAPTEYGAYYSCFASTFSDRAKFEKGIHELNRGLQGLDTSIDPQQLFSRNLQEESKMATKYTALASLVSVDKRFCITEKGYIGWVPNGSRVGDKVSLVFGAQTPFVMRKYGKDDENGVGDWKDFVLVGACYLHGMMDGEGLNVSGEQEVRYVVLH